MVRREDSLNYSRKENGGTAAVFFKLGFNEQQQALIAIPPAQAGARRQQYVLYIIGVIVHADYVP